MYAAYIGLIISKVNHSNMNRVYINRYFNETILSYTCSMNIFDKCTMNYIYKYCFVCQPCHLKLSMACNVCIFVLLRIYLWRCFLHMTLLSIKQDTLPCTIVLYIFAPHYNANQIRLRGGWAFLAPEPNILINYERLFSCMFNILYHIFIITSNTYVQIYSLIITYYHFPRCHIYCPKGNYYFLVYCINYVYVFTIWI